MGLFCLLVAAQLSIRRPVRGERASLRCMALAVLGTFGMTALASQPVTTSEWCLLAVGDSLLVVGLVGAIYATASLGRCFGLAPEARGVVTSGPYRLVRHPLYVFELLAALGALLPVFGPATLGAFLLFGVVQSARARLEERALAAAFPAYTEYRRRTPAVLPRAASPASGKDEHGALAA
jgi:protein-S-isoprenylcysteine O-methyltransferase Ste14